MESARAIAQITAVLVRRAGEEQTVYSVSEPSIALAVRGRRK